MRPGKARRSTLLILLSTLILTGTRCACPAEHATMPCLGRLARTSTWSWVACDRSSWNF